MHYWSSWWEADKTLFTEIIAEDFPNLMQIINPHPRSSVNPKQKKYKEKNTPKHIIIKMLKSYRKEKILKAEEKALII